jgi:hypothetical protein
MKRSVLLGIYTLTRPTPIWKEKRKVGEKFLFKFFSLFPLVT